MFVTVHNQDNDTRLHISQRTGGAICLCRAELATGACVGLETSKFHFETVELAFEWAWVHSWHIMVAAFTLLLVNSILPNQKSKSEWEGFEQS